MQIRITNPDQFSSLLDALSGEAVDAAVYFRLHMDLSDAVPTYRRAMNQSGTFWSLTLHATLDAALSRLCRVYDQDSDALSLRNLLDTVEANLHVFEVESFRQRLRDNPFVETLAQSARKPNADMLARDMESVGKNDPLVHKLIIWRNNMIAHRTASNVVKLKDIAKEYPLAKDDVSTLVDRATSIVNRYSSLFRASTYSPVISGHDDYTYVLGSIEARMQRQADEIRAARLTRKRRVCDDV